MSIVERDFILRMIQRFAQALAAILAKRREGKTDDALALLERARADAFGAMREALDAVDAASVTSLLGAPDKIRVYAAFLAVEADLRADRGEAQAAARARRRTLTVLLEAATRAPNEVRDEDRKTIAELAAHVDAARLPERLRATLLALKS
jgi:hypothetical protein